MLAEESWWTAFLNFLEAGDTISILTWKIPILRIIALAAGIVLLFLVLQIIKRLLFRLAKLNAFPAEIYNGLLFVIRLLFGVGLIYIILTFLNINSDYVLIISGLIGTAIAFASVKTITNFVAGIWIALTSPYILGDYVKIGKVEGIVVKITSFYSYIRTHRENTILIPNLTCLNSNILNYSINIASYRRKSHDLKKKVSDLEKQTSKRWKHRNEILLQDLKKEITEKEILLSSFDKYQHNLVDIQDRSHVSEYVQRDKIIRYIFTLDLPKRWKFVETQLDKACQDFRDKYNFHIESVLINITSHLVYEFTLITLDPMDILQYSPEMITTLYEIIYQQ